MKADAASDYFIEALGDGHDRSSFSCGVELLDRYLRERAGQDSRRRIASPFVMIHRTTRSLAGFYTVANSVIAVDELPAVTVKRLPKYPFIPATLLGLLAVDLRHRGKGLGEFLLLDALHRCCSASRSVASFAVRVDAKDEMAAAFYQKYGFAFLEDSRKRLFLPMQAIDQTIHGL